MCQNLCHLAASVTDWPQFGQDWEILGLSELSRSNYFGKASQNVQSSGYLKGKDLSKSGSGMRYETPGQPADILAVS